MTGPSGRLIIEALLRADVRTVVALPDIWTSNGLLFPISNDPRLQLIRVCKEDEAIAICAGMWIGGKRAVAMMQHTGYLDSVNAIRGAVIEGHVPVCMLVGLLHKEPNVSVDTSNVLGIRCLAAINQSLGLDAMYVETDLDADELVRRIDDAFARSVGLGIFLGQRPVAS